MPLHRLCLRICRLLCLLFFGSVMGIASKCDPEVSATVFGGMQTLASALVAAFFDNLLIQSGITPVSASAL